MISGSIAKADLWKGYKNIEKFLIVSHQTVNLSIYFKDPETNVHINTIECLNNGIKFTIVPRNEFKRTVKVFTIVYMA